MDQTVKVHIVNVDVSRTVSSSLGPALRHPVRSRILLPRLRATGKWRILLPRPFATTFDLDFGPVHQAPSSDGASFFACADLCPPAAGCRTPRLALSAWLPFRLGDCSNVASPPDSCFNELRPLLLPGCVLDGSPASASRPLKAPLIPSSGAFSLLRDAARVPGTHARPADVLNHPHYPAAIRPTLARARPGHLAHGRGPPPRAPTRWRRCASASSSA